MSARGVIQVRDKLEAVMKMDSCKDYKTDTELAELVSLADLQPDDATIHFRLACAHDRAGREAAAVSCYERALALGLIDPADAAAAFLGLGSTYRVLGRYSEAVRILEEGTQRFPEYQALTTFLAMALYNVGRHAEAMRLLLDLSISPARHASLAAYSRAILFYSERLDEVWPG